MDMKSCYYCKQSIEKGKLVQVKLSSEAQNKEVSSNIESVTINPSPPPPPPKQLYDGEIPPPPPPPPQKQDPETNENNKSNSEGTDSLNTDPKKIIDKISLLSDIKLPEHNIPRPIKSEPNKAIQYSFDNISRKNSVDTIKSRQEVKSGNIDNRQIFNETCNKSIPVGGNYQKHSNFSDSLPPEKRTGYNDMIYNQDTYSKRRLQINPQSPYKEMNPRPSNDVQIKQNNMYIPHLGKQYNRQIPYIANYQQSLAKASIDKGSINMNYKRTSEVARTDNTYLPAMKRAQYVVPTSPNNNITQQSVFQGQLFNQKAMPCLKRSDSSSESQKIPEKSSSIVEVKAYLINHGYMLYFKFLLQ